MATLYLGSCDKGKIPQSRKAFLKPFHIDGLLINKVSFRDDNRTKWRSFREGNSNDVVKLQLFLFHAGFMPRSVFDGVFGYVTQASVRLFQEYIRTEENIENMVPDGIVGSGTMKHIQRWKDEKKVSDWGKTPSSNPTLEYKAWMNLLRNAKNYYKNTPGPILTTLNGLSNTYSSFKVNDWRFNTSDIHLIGVRRNQTQQVERRENDDLFFLLINGMVFTFWGSTDPSVNMAQRNDEPFLIEGQHKYRFGWHKISVEKKIYKALKPQNSAGVMVVRDWDNNNALTNNDLQIRDSNGQLKGMQVNPSINIHWSGIGHSNFSAGCQVIAGKSYLNHKNELQDCSKFASTSYAELTDLHKKTKGAYNVFTDLILCYAAPNVTEIFYTLGREESLNIDSNFGSQYALNIIKKLKSI